MSSIRIDSRNGPELKKLLHQKWPQVQPVSGHSELTFRTSISALDGLFPQGGIPYGQLIEISGCGSSGKTRLLFSILANLTKTSHAAYVDFSNCFFPAAAVAAGMDINRLIVIRPENHLTGMRVAELLLQQKLAACVVCDLVGQAEALPPAMLHRLRTRTVRARGLMIFLTENNSHLIPTSMISLRLEVKRKSRSRLTATVTKSRFSPEGATVEVNLHEH